MSNTQRQVPTTVVRPTITLNASGTTCLGSGAMCDVQLDHPLIAPRHVEFVLGSNQPLLRDLGAGTFVNGRKVVGKSIPIQSEDQIDVGPYTYTFTGAHLESVASMDYVQLTGIGLTRVVPDGRSDRTILDNITLVFLPGQFVCLLGPSGCGKSTLMNVLSGRDAPTSGDVRVNHRHLYTDFDALKNHIVLVPQETILHSGLTARQALRFTARLRLPASKARLKRVEKLLSEMQIDKQSAQEINTLSGGQKKRLSLANELLSDPGLIFLDEVTSGLDPHIDADLMRQLRNLAEGHDQNGDGHQKPKTIVCITHSVEHVVGNCHQVVFLTEGGRLAFVGSPEEALKYFDVDHLDKVYPKLSADQAETVAGRFANSPEYAAYLEERLPENERPTAGPLVVAPPVRRRPRMRVLNEIGTTAYQTALLIWRQLILLSKDSATLLSLLGQVFLVAIVLFMAFGIIGSAFPHLEPDEQTDEELINDLPKGKEIEEVKKRHKKDFVPKISTFKRFKYVRKILDLGFLLAVICFWLGCNNSAREIVRERNITTQEVYFNLRPLAYYLSKLFVLTLISWLQVSLFLAITRYCCALPENPWHALPILLALALAGTSLGLLISAISRSERVAITLIPIAIMPQIILSGAIVKLCPFTDDLSQTIVTTYSGKKAMDALLERATLAGDFARKPYLDLIQSEGTIPPLAIILLHAAIFAILTVAALSTDGTIGAIVRKLGAWCSRLCCFSGQRQVRSTS